MNTKEAQLHNLLILLFSNIEELRLLVSNLPEGRMIERNLPTGNINITNYSYLIIDELSRRGGIGSDFFELLLSLRPQETSSIREVWKLWESTPEDWSAPPGNDINKRLRTSSSKKNEGEAVQVFVSYSRRDRLFYEELQSHLAVLNYQGIIDIWSEGRILAGEKWKDVIEKAIDDTDIFILLISPDFMASEYSARFELEKIQKRATEGAIIIPVLVRATHISDNHIIGQFQALPLDGVPIASRDDTDDAWIELAENIRSAAKKLIE